MLPIAASVIATVTAPYGVDIQPAQLAARICDPKSVETFDGPVFSFLSDVSPDLQLAFIEQMGVNEQAVKTVARQFSSLAGYTLPLAA